MSIPLFLKDKSIYKLSMRSLFVNKKHPLLKKLKANSWLVIDGSAGAGQGDSFKSQAQLGDYVYVCIGSSELWGLYRFTGNWLPLPDDIQPLLPAGNDWGYRAAELVAKPIKNDIGSLKHINKHWAPSGFSTFRKLTDLEGANELFFEPFFDRTLVSDILPDKSASPMPLNQILYGPPGTGKTYHTTARAVALLEGISDDELAAKYPTEKRAELRQKFEDYRAAGRIAFVTFHQAFTYEDFVEGIKPLPPAPAAVELGEQDDEPGKDVTVHASNGGVQYDIRKGIFRQMCDTAVAYANYGAARTTALSISFDELYAGFLDHLDNLLKHTSGPVLLPTKKSNDKKPSEVELINVDKESGQLTFRYPRGKEVERGYIADRDRIKKLYKLYSSIEQITNLQRDISNEVGGSHMTLLWVGFNALKRYENNLELGHRIELAPNSSPPFVLIIDEINRGNVANIFGELITLLEDDKRAGRSEALTVTLPYSKEEFSVPSNLYLLGTMNTADRSVEALDTALRRRFSFTEMLPLPELLPTDMEGINLQKMLTAINVRLEQLLNHDHCIGHALLMRVTTLDGLREAFRRNILPLLQEYFFGDWGKIGLVIGNAFIYSVSKKQNATGYKLMPFDKYSTGELSEKPVYKLTDVLKLEAKAFQDIYA